MFIIPEFHHLFAMRQASLEVPSTYSWTSTRHCTLVRNHPDNLFVPPESRPPSPGFFTEGSTPQDAYPAYHHFLLAADHITFADTPFLISDPLDPMEIDATEIQPQVSVIEPNNALSATAHGTVGTFHWGNADQVANPLHHIAPHVSAEREDVEMSEAPPLEEPVQIHPIEPRADVDTEGEHGNVGDRNFARDDPDDLDDWAQHYEAEAARQPIAAAEVEQLIEAHHAGDDEPAPVEAWGDAQPAEDVGEWGV